MSATLRANTSRHRFDEARRFTGVYQRMGQIGVDADWNEEVAVRTVDARRRSGDLAEGSPDDGFRICGDFLVDPVTPFAGWSGTRLPPSDLRSQAVSELRLDRRDGETLPWVIRSRWHTAVRRTLPAPLDLRTVAGGGVAFAARHVVFEVRIERLPADLEDVTPEVFLDDGAVRAVPIAGALASSGWSRIAVPVADFAGLDRSRVIAWGVRGLPPMSPVWIGALRVTDPDLGDDVVIAGGDGTLAGAGRMLIEGVRTFLERDLRYGRQPDLPEAPALPALPADGTRQHGFYLDVWEQTITALDDPSLLEPALDGVETGARLRLVTQVRALPALPAGPLPALPAPTGGGRLTTNVAAGPPPPDRDPPEPPDPCRDRCLATEDASTGAGYVGSDNLHVRLEVLRTVPEPGAAALDDVILWSRDNGSTVLALAQSAPAAATSIRLAPADAARLRAGDVIAIEDRTTRLRWDAPRPAVVRRVRGVQTETGVIELEDPGQLRTDGSRRLDLGGPLGREFTVEDRAQVRRWDGADLLVTGVRYRLRDGIAFVLGGAGFRSGDYWTFTARVHAPDGAARGVVEQLTDAPPHGPVHRHVVLGRARAAAPGAAERYAFEDLRPRFLPLTQVRDRLRELGARRFGPGTFTIVIGDGERTFGDIDQSVAEGITGDEALQIALDRLRGAGGSVFVRAGTYQLEHPVLVSGLSSVRILGDGDGTRVEARGAGGAFYLDRCGPGGAVALEDLTLIEDPEAELEVPGAPGPLERLELLLAGRVAPRLVRDERLLRPEDVEPAAPPADFARLFGEAVRAGLAPGGGRASGSVISTLAELRRLQREGEGVPLEDNPEAAPLLAALDRLPHGVVTIADSRRIAVRGCVIESRRARAGSIGVLVTGTCAELELTGCDVRAATGVAAAPYAPYASPAFLLAFPRAGLDVTGLTVADCRISGGPAGDPATGVHLADGRLAGVVIRDNQIAGFPVGVLIEDAAEDPRDAAGDRLRVSGNRIAAAVAGVQLAADGVDVSDNEIVLAAPGEGDEAGEGDEPLLSAGVIAAGSAIRIADGWISLPGPGPRSPLALAAGIVIGDGLDAGGPARPVADVEVTGNRIEGAGADSLAAGVVIGGPQPIAGVRVHGNVLRDLGDAGVRVYSTSAPIGRLAIERNRIERVALADPPARFDNLPALRRLSPAAAAGLASADVTRPRPLLAALVGASAPAVRPALDAALRWVERLTLRGAIALGGVDGASVTGNRIAEVGRAEPYAAPNVDGARIHAAGIAAVAGAEVTIDGNEIEAVRAPLRRLPGGGEEGGGRPAVLALLEQLGAAADRELDRADVHLTVADLRARLLRYAAGGADERARQARSLFGPLDAAAGELAGLGGRTAALAEVLRRELAELRIAATPAEQLGVATAMRATLSQAASATIAGARAQDAWDAAAQLDLALLRDADAIRETAQRLAQRLDDLTEGLGAPYREALEVALSRLATTPGDAVVQLAAAGALGRVAAVRDLALHREELPAAAELVGPRRSVVEAFAGRAADALDDLAAGGDANRERLTELRVAKDALVRELAEVHGALALDVDADLRDVDRTDGASPLAVERLRGTLRKIAALAGGPAAPPDAGGEDALRADARNRAGAIHFYARQLDRQLGGLLDESPESVERSLRSFSGVMDQLVELAADDPSIADLAAEAGARVAEARADAGGRAEHLSEARGLLELLRGRLVPVLPEVPGAPARPGGQARRLAALAAAAIELPALAPELQAPALDAIEGLLGRAHVALDADAGVRQAAARAIAVARRALGGDPEPLARAVHGLADAVAGAAALARAADEDDAEAAAASVLASAAALALDPAEDEATRLQRLQGHLGARTAQVSAVLAAQADAQLELAPAVALVRGALERLARGEQPAPGDAGEPRFDVEPDPADGVFVAGPGVRARIAGNQIAGAAAGVRVAGAAGHAVTEPPADGAVIEVAGNRITACAIAGLEVRADGRAAVIVGDNHVLGCAGAAVRGPDAWGQAVIEIVGAGELIVHGNLLAENGNRALRTLLHELVVDWRGEASVRGNTVRHLGGGAGGAGVLVLAEPVAAELIAALSRAPFLGVEPAPRPAGPGRPPRRQLLPLAAQSPLAAAAAGGEPALALGNLRQADRRAPVVHRALTFTTPARTAPPLAAALAASYLDRERSFVARPVLDFLRRRPIVMAPRPPARPHHAVHVEGNDVSAHGPALLLLCEGGTLWAATVVGNQLASAGRAGAVYLRRTDATVLTGNRCESPGAINTVLVRCGKAPVTATGNVVLGAAPIRPRPGLAVPPDDGAVTLRVGVGDGALDIPLDARKLLGSLERRRTLAGDLFAELLADLQPPPEPEPEPEPERPEPERPEPERPEPEGPVIGRRPPSRPALRTGTRVSSTLLTRELRARLAAELPAGAPPAIGARTVYTHAAEDTPADALKKLIERLSLHAEDEAGVRIALTAVLTAAGGDPVRALALVDEEVLGLAAARAPVKDAVIHTSLIAEAIAEHLAATAAPPAPPARRGSFAAPTKPAAPRPPEPAAHSLVVIGGSHVATVGNATTAGVLILEADRTVELDT